jgi:hypothetical protein
MAASEYVANRPGGPLGPASHSISQSSQTSREPRRRSAALYSDQSVVRVQEGAGLLMAAQMDAPSPSRSTRHRDVQQRLLPS